MTRPRGSTLICGVVVAMAILGVVGESPADVRMIWPGLREMRHGVQARLEMIDAANEAGYRACRVEILAPNGPSPVTRTFVVRLRTDERRSMRRLDHAMSVKIVLKAGSTAAKRTVPLPLVHDGQSPWFLDVMENGRLLEEMSDVQVRRGWTTQFAQSSKGGYFLLVLHSGLDAQAGNESNPSAEIKKKPLAQLETPFPDVVALANQLSETNVTLQQIAARRLKPPTELLEAADLLDSLGRADVWSLDRAAKNWLELSGYTAVLVHMNDVRVLQAKHPQAFAALLNWTAAGGLLIVTGAPDAAARETLWRLCTDGKSPNGSRGGWSVVDKSARFHSQDGTPFQPLANADSASPLRWRPYLAGRVYALESDDAASGPFGGWFRTVMRSAGQKRHSVARRLGGRHFGKAQDQSAFHVPGVGDPPVAMFLVLITGFAVLIGPVNFFLLRTLRRMQWMMITAPMLAIAVTTLILTFALFTDGIYVQQRVVSVTLLDQVVGRAVSASRQSFYAAMGKDALTYPVDTATFCLADYAARRGSLNRYTEEIGLDGDKRLMGAYIPTRNLVQYTVIRPQATTARIQFSKDSQGNLTATNELGADILQLVVMDANGKLFHCRGLPDGATIQFDPDTEPWFGDSPMGQALARVSPNSSNPRERRYPVLWFRDSTIVDVALADLKPGQYRCVVAGDSHVPLGVSNPQLVSSSFLIFGQWR